MKPEIVSVDFGRHNQDLDAAAARLERQGYYRDLSTIIIVPSLGSVPTKVVASWWSLVTPPNQKVLRLFPTGMEVGAAYSSCIEMILANQELAKFKYILTLEADNAPPPDGLMKLLERAEANPHLDCVGGLYWTKGEGGAPQIWGNPNEHPLNFKPMLPKQGELVECCGTGMGFNLFRTEMFKNQKLRKPWFRTVAGNVDGQGVKMYTQDLWFWEDARKNGHRCAIDCGVLVGHYDTVNDVMW